MRRAVIFANGDASGLESARNLIEKHDTIICADGGALHALSLGFSPNIVIGDLDSLPSHIASELEAGGTRIIRKPKRKAETDLELAMRYAVNSGAAEILVLAVTGGRLDQTLANLLLLAGPEWNPARIMLAEGDQRAWLLRGPDELEVRGRAGDTFSLIPLGGGIRGVTLEGFEWSLKDGSFPFGSTEPVSNSLTRDLAIVKISSGVALAVLIPAKSD